MTCAFSGTVDAIFHGWQASGKVVVEETALYITNKQDLQHSKDNHHLGAIVLQFVLFNFLFIN